MLTAYATASYLRLLYLASEVFESDGRAEMASKGLVIAISSHDGYVDLERGLRVTNWLLYLAGKW